MVASTNKRILVSDVDFDAIKSNLVTFMQGQSQFAGYDFNGAAMNVLMDVLAYNTHYNALYQNLALNESFIDSASKRSSVVSLANNLGYTPQSTVSARAVVNMTLSGVSSPTSTYTLPKYSQFSATTSASGYNFYTLYDNVAAYSTAGYVFNNLTLVEGTPLKFQYTVTDPVNQIFTIPNTGVDLSTLFVKVQATGSSTNYTLWTNAASLVDVTSTSTVYFIRELDDGTYELMFGDGVIGAALQVGNVINLEYFASSSSAANGIATFGYVGASLSGGTTVCTTVSASAGGADAEAAALIKFNAPRSFSAQNRAVTVNDYAAIVNQFYSNSAAVNVWGGDKNDPPQYGKVFLAIKTKDGNKISDFDKARIQNDILGSRNIVSIFPVIVDPTYIDISVNTTFYYNSALTSKTATVLSTLVNQDILDYNNNFSNFGGVFRYSNLVSGIDTADTAIVSNVTKIKMNVELLPIIGSSAQYTWSLLNPVYNVAGSAGISLNSTGFYIDSTSTVYYMDDDGNGNIRVYSLAADGSKIIVNAFAGTIVYSTGKITIPSLYITSIVGSNLYLTLRPASNDIISVRSQLLRIQQKFITITAISDKVAAGNANGGTNFVFTPST